ncbi:hypothetical protein H2203_005396 [Taxawa tesnikishii (nom. ined.)]|nr:hypothetical protein H2203_005396 [Dothideales sp. JES 119]
MASNTTSAPFSKAVVSAMRKLYPESLADKSFDNTGLLLESPFDPLRRQMNSVLLTVDLTKAVADEAIERNDSIIVAYHPVIFRGLKSLTLSDSQQRSLLRLAAEGISVYSPHTAIDAAPGGLGDWLADVVSGTPSDQAQDESTSQASSSRPASPTKRSASPTKRDRPTPLEQDDPFLAPRRPTFQLQHHPSQLSLQSSAIALNKQKHTRSPIIASKVPGYENTGAGMGRIVRFSSPQPLLSIIDRIGLGLGNPKGFPIAVPQGKTMDQISISSVAICAGSGGHLFSPSSLKEHVDLLFTGSCRTMRRWRRSRRTSVLKPQLEKTIREEWDRIRKEEMGRDGLSEDYRDLLEDDHVEVQVSEVDRDPFGIMISKDEV